MPKYGMDIVDTHQVYLWDVDFTYYKQNIEYDIFF